MYSVWSVIAGLTVAGILFWLSVLTYFIWKQRIFLKSLFPKSGERDIRKKFEEVLENIGNFKKGLEEFDNKLSVFEENSLKHIQKVKLLRFNPYQETGGNISFTVSLLDEKGNGVVLTSLHARSGTRVFAKPVKEGKGGKYQLSSEEEEVVRKAMVDE